MANLMDLVRELKQLNALKKAGDVLSPEAESRRKELKAYLRTTLEAQGGGNSIEDSAVKEPASGRSSSAPKPVPAASSAPKPVPAASSAPKPVPVSSTAPQTPRAMPDPATTKSSSSPRPVSTPTAQPMGFMEDMLPPIPKQKASAPSAELPGGRPKAPEAQPQEAPKPYVPKKNAFVIDAGSLIDDAANSDAVAKVDPFANRHAHASRAEVEDAEARAESALRANKKKDRAKTADEAVEQLQESEAAYTPSEDSFMHEQYYGDFANEGFERVDARDAPNLKPIDPREIELAKLDVAAGPGGAVPAGLAFLDDFPALYSRRVLPAPDDEVVVDSTDPNLLIPGKRKVTVQMLNGEKKLGAIRSLRRGDLGFKLEPIGSGQTEELSISQVKAVFIHTQANSAPKAITGRSLTATFRDGRAVQGLSDDYQPGAPVFTLVPPQGRGQFERIIVNGAAVQSVQ